MRPLLLVLVLAVGASAQPDLRPPPDAPSVAVDAVTAFGDDYRYSGPNLQGTGTYEVDLNVTSLVLTTTARVPILGRWTAVAEVPLSVSRFDQTVTGMVARPVSGTDVRVDLGNVAVGVEAQVRDGLRLGGAVRLPTTTRGSYVPVDEVQADPLYSGLAADQEHPEAYIPDLLTLAASADLAVPVAPLLGLRLRLAPVLLLDTESEERTDVALGYGLHLDVRAGPAALSVGGVGRQYGRDDVGLGGLYESDLAFVLGGRVEVGGVRPGVTARIPLFERYQFADAAVGVSLDVPIR